MGCVITAESFVAEQRQSAHVFFVDHWRWVLYPARKSTEL
jgi:hypothetical protein